ncbi:MAG: 2Fe-2S iron-sulfur cluster-binding protein [Acidobacteriota bacterium]|nr:2Fe-2S iron-sulfur cluster-binding protein [Acidobacteriota bacterium]
MATLLVDGQRVEARAGDSLLVAMLRTGVHPTGGGCLCMGGDCPNCLVTVDGVAYTRSCQVPARDGMVVRREHLGGEEPALLSDEPTSAESAAPVRHVHCDTVVIGQGDSGREVAREARDAGLDVVTLDARDGQQVTGVYPGPLVVAADRAGRVLHVHPRCEIVVATGAAELQPVVPGSDLEGLVTARAAAALVTAGIDLGRAVAVGERPAGLPPDSLVAHFPVGEGGWELVRFEGDGRIEAVVLRRHGDADAAEERIECNTAVLGLGRNPRNALARMASDLPVRVVGSAAMEPELPPCPGDGTVCPCSGVTVADLDGVWERGFHEMELLKRATLAGTGTCQGGVCLPYLRSFLLQRGGRLQPAFTARPLNRQLTVRELAAGAHTAVTARSPLHDEHLSLGARMDRAGGWWRPWTYDRKDDEYRSVRERVSLGDVSSLGKMAISGPDAEAFLERIVPTRVATIRPGRCRYVLMLDERGYLLDDGMLCREADQDAGDRFFLTSTSGGSGFFELWLRDWVEAFGCDVRILNQTASLAAINVTGPQAARLLARAGARELPAFGRHQAARIAGVDCRVVRLSFTGELSYELHHPAADARTLWRRLLAAGAGFNVQPHGLETLLRLRLEKGHIVIGHDTDYDSTPRRLAHEWAVNLNKGDFVGHQAIVRTNKQPPDKRLVTLLTDDPPPRETVEGPSAEGAAIHDGERYAGYVTSDAGTTAGGGAPMLGWLYLDAEGSLPREVTVDGRTARRVDGPTYDPEGERARAAVDIASESPQNVREFPVARPEATDLTAEAPAEPPRLRRLEATRVSATPKALDALVEQPPWPAGALAFRIAPDELLVTATPDLEVAGDPHAIVERETAFSYVWLDEAKAERFLERECEWRRPGARPAFAQGEVAGIPAKLWFEAWRTLVLTPAPFAAAFQRRLTRSLEEPDGDDA